jgi:hypothetical protein
MPGQTIQRNGTPLPAMPHAVSTRSRGLMQATLPKLTYSGGHASSHSRQLWSPRSAHDVLQHHNAAFSTRSVPDAARACAHDEHSMGWLPSRVPCGAPCARCAPRSPSRRNASTCTRPSAATRSIFALQ